MQPSRPSAHVRLLAFAIVIPLVLGACGGADRDLPEHVEFNRHIRPILSDRCFVCHGPDSGTREADLRLDLREVATALRDGYDHAAIVPGDPGASELVRRINSSDPDERMPPPGSRDPLTEHEKDLLERWIAQGAEWQPHWLYVPPRKVEPPTPRADSRYVRNPIDAFIVARLESVGLEPSEEADAATLARRVALDLTGLPPHAPDLIERTGGYERLVDSLLASPHYGERMALMWLDLVRYADTDGYHSDLHRNVSPFREYVIRAFNINKPYDQFTREQIAGDLLPHATTEQLVAAGFNRLGQATKEGGAQPKEYLAKYASDRVRTVSTTWMGSTVGCAECHDHKFDPFTQADFYKMSAFFADVKERGVFLNLNVLPPEMPLPTDEEAEALREMDRTIAARREQNLPVEAVLARREELLAGMPQMLATKSVEPRLVRVLRRGDWKDQGGPIVEPDIPEFLDGLDVEGRRANRLDLANWLVSESNPMAARVFVNHLWAQFFGTGISRVLDDLGSQGEWPTHPDLLDWLAVEFMESGWDVKHMVRLIVTSATYRQSSRSTEAQRELDPENRLLARQARVRLPAELVRDNALAVSGLLDTRMGGESVKPYQPEGYWSEIQTFGTDGPASSWEASEGGDQYRRGVYTYWKRSFVHPAMLAFDAPDRQECTALRARSNTPLQALVLLNDPSFVESARVFAERIVTERGGMRGEVGDATAETSNTSANATGSASGEEVSVESRIRWAFTRALARPLTETEADELVRYFQEELDEYRTHEDEAAELIASGQSPIPDHLDVAELAAWTSLARALFNTHEFITRY